MIAPELTLTDLTWEELLNNINHSLKEEEERIATSKSFYMKLFQSESPNKQQLKRMYDNLQNDQKRLDNFSELLRRFQTFNALAVVAAIDQCEQSEKEINGKAPDYFHLFILKKAEGVFTSYFPVK